MFTNLVKEQYLTTKSVNISKFVCLVFIFILEEDAKL